MLQVEAWSNLEAVGNFSLLEFSTVGVSWPYHTGLVQGKDASKLLMKSSRGCSLYRYGCPPGPVRNQEGSFTWYRVESLIL